MLETIWRKNRSSSPANGASGAALDGSGDLTDERRADEAADERNDGREVAMAIS
jgi:hypothetical protein